jgi:hypothetical protein
VRIMSRRCFASPATGTTTSYIYFANRANGNSEFEPVRRLPASHMLTVPRPGGGKTLSVIAPLKSRKCLPLAPAQRFIHFRHGNAHGAIAGAHQPAIQVYAIAVVQNAEQAT